MDTNATQTWLAVLVRASTGTVLQVEVPGPSLAEAVEDAVAVRRSLGAAWRVDVVYQP